MTRPIREIKVTNTLSGKKEILETRVPGKLSMYSCGPTVYNFIHIGNLRAALVADQFFRYFKKVGYDVTFVRNFTDVDDKIIKKANEEKLTSDEIAKRYIIEVEKDYALAGLHEPTHKTKVTEHMPEIIGMIEKIIANGKAYVAEKSAGEEGYEVLFSISSFEGYGKLSHKNIDDLVAGHRVEVSEKKHNPLDFTLWKPAKPGEPSWDSPWGKGRPGWHIECSAMAGKWLGDQMDLHHGGEDLVFPHHENEIAQSEACTGHAPYVKYWLHSAFLNMGKEKMSKSLGNVLGARDFLVRFGTEFTRYLLLSVHYRSIIDFGDEAIEHTLIALHRIYEAKAKALQISQLKMAMPDLRAESAWGSFMSECEAVRREMDDHFANDFNTAGAVASLFTLIRSFNRTLAEPRASATPSAILGAQELIKVMEMDLGDVLGIGRGNPEKMLADLERIKAERATASGTLRMTEDEIKAAIQARADARKAKDFAQGDRIRKDLESKGVMIKDSPQGTAWEYI
ncbi:MAG: cysteine--tRNA ligase [Methylotenera sp.]|nr:cysteine--tRNA ligase [Oligoflexia bacterium]